MSGSHRRARRGAEDIAREGLGTATREGLGTATFERPGTTAPVGLAPATRRGLDRAVRRAVPAVLAIAGAVALVPAAQAATASPPSPGQAVLTAGGAPEPSPPAPRVPAGDAHGLVASPVPIVAARTIGTTMNDGPDGLGVITGDEPLVRVATFSVTCYAMDGTTASGEPVGPEAVAVDPAVIPLGTRLWVDGVGWRTALDTGPAIRGTRLDIWDPSEEACVAWGVRRREVWMAPSDAANVGSLEWVPLEQALAEAGWPPAEAGEAEGELAASPAAEVSATEPAVAPEPMGDPGELEPGDGAAPASAAPASAAVDGAGDAGGGDAGAESPPEA